VRRVTDAAVHLAAQPRIDTLVTAYPGGESRLRSDYAGIAWIGGRPDDERGIAGPDYRRREVDTRLFLPDTHWYDLAAVDGLDVQVSAGLLQVAGTSQGTQGLVASLAEPVVEFFEHPEGLDGVGICLWLRGRIWSNVGLSYRVTVLGDPAAVLRTSPVEEAVESD
jgi:hypothetical protein